MATHAFRVLSLFSGVAGLDLGVRAAFPNARTILYCEREVYAARVLASRMAEGKLDTAPIFSDVTKLDGTRWAGSVDCILAGFPCPPASVAGKRLGTKDDRWLWPEIVRLLRETQAGFFMGENVGGLFSVEAGRAFGGILRDLADIGMRVEWCRVSAGDVGAPHRRERIFILACRATLADTSHGLIPVEGRGSQGREGAGSGSPSMADAQRLRSDDTETSGRDGAGEPSGRAGDELGNAQRSRREASGIGRDINAGGEPEVGCGGVDNSTGPRCDGRIAGQGSAARDEARLREPGGRCDGLADSRHPGLPLSESPALCGARGSDEGRAVGELRLPQFPPGPGDRDAWARILRVRPDLAPAVEAEAELAVRGLDDELRPDLVEPSRTDALRALGNAVVPAQAEAAFRILYERITGDVE